MKVDNSVFFGIYFGDKKAPIRKEGLHVVFMKYSDQSPTRNEIIAELKKVNVYNDFGNVVSSDLLFRTVELKVNEKDVLFPVIFVDYQDENSIDHYCRFFLANFEDDHAVMRDLLVIDFIAFKHSIADINYSFGNILSGEEPLGYTEIVFPE